MKARCPNLVEVLFVILVAAILFAIAIPLYLGQSQMERAKRTKRVQIEIAKQCASNLQAITMAERKGASTTDMRTLEKRGVFKKMPACPLGGKPYTLSLNEGLELLVIRCPNAKEHHKLTTTVVIEETFIRAVWPPLSDDIDRSPPLRSSK